MKSLGLRRLIHVYERISNDLRLDLTAMKSLVVSELESLGELAIFCVRVIRAALIPPHDWGELLRQCDEIGSTSLLLVALTGAATGAVMSCANT